MSFRMAVGNLFECKWWTLMGSQIGITTWHWAVSATAGLGAYPEDLRDWISLNTAGDFKACLSIQSFFRGITLQQIWPGTKPRPLIDPSGAGAGGGAGIPLPKQVSGIIKKLTELSGRAYRGRMYIPFPSAGDNEAVEGRPTGNYLARLTSFATDIEDPVTVGLAPDTTTLSPCLVHRANPGTFNFITDTEPSPYWGTQRRRGDYGPKNIAPF